MLGNEGLLKQLKKLATLFFFIIIINIIKFKHDLLSVSVIGICVGIGIRDKFRLYYEVLTILRLLNQNKQY